MRSVTPMTVVSPTRPRRIRYRYRPMNRAMGMVQAMVKVPHGLWLRAFTTARPRPASATMMMNRMATEAAAPATGPDLLLRDFGQGLPVAADRSEQDDEIVDGSGEHRADQDPEGAGQVAELRGEHRADQRPGPGDGREMVAEQDPFVCRVIIPTVRHPDRGRDIPVIEHEDTGSQPGAVKPVSQ